MNFEFTEQAKEWQERVKSFMNEHCYPIEKEVHDFVEDHNNRWKE